MTVSAIVVTYNRLALLKECVDAIRNQTHRPNAIIVVNNSSTDGTLEWLNQQDDIKVITQENSGSAGGQYTGMKTAFDDGYDWIWTLDDDGKPVHDTLQLLMGNASKDVGVLHPLVFSPDDPNIFSFGCWVKENDHFKLYKTYQEFLDKYKDAKTLISIGTPFNGSLFNRAVVEKYGLPKKELFIWGEESEYLTRLKKYDVKSIVVCDAKFYHPHNPKIYDMLSMEKKDWWKLYYYFRNDIEIISLFHKSPMSELIFLKHRLKNLFYLIVRKRILDSYKLRVLFTATFHGILRRFGANQDIQLKKL